MSFFKCKVCAEKEARINDLKAQLALVNSQLYPEANPDARLTELEMDGVMSGQQHIIEIPLSAKDEAEQSERDRLFSGTFEN